MQQNPVFERIRTFFSAIFSENNQNRALHLMVLFLLIVLLVGYIIPQLEFGRFYGSDTYSHLVSTNIMAASRGISEFYDAVADLSKDPSDESTGMNYPFGLWLFGSIIAKITGFSPVTVDFFFFVIFFPLVLIGSFYIYSGIWLRQREQKVCAILFLLSMPLFSLGLTNYSPNNFILPFLFIALYFILKEPVDWKFFPFALLSIFIIIISHTGSFIFFFSLLTAFFLLYCLFWGKLSKIFFIAITSTLTLYCVTLTIFPQIASQYRYTSQNFLVPGNFIAETFNFPLPGEIVRVFYQNMLIEYQFIYVIIFATLLFAIGYILIFINREAELFLFKRASVFPAFILPIQNLSHSAIVSPIWIGPVQTFFSIFGFFHLDNKGKCFLLTSLLITLLPDMLKRSEGIAVGSGALRQISYLVIIIPITATLGFWHILDYLNNSQSKTKTLITSALWITVCLVMMITPIVATSYYNPTLSGEDYVIDGVKWLGEYGDHSEYVSAYQLRPLNIYSNMTGPYVQSGYEFRTYTRLLRTVYFMPGWQIDAVEILQKKFGIRYIFSSDRILRIFGGTTEDLTISSNPALDRIFASNDFHIYDSGKYLPNPVVESHSEGNIIITYKGGNYEVESDFYRVTVGANTPVLKRLGPPQNDYLNYGYLTEEFLLSGTETPSEGENFKLEDLEFVSNIKDNQIEYMTILINPNNDVPIGTLHIRYTFYPDVIRRDYSLSNDWHAAQSSPQIFVRYIIRSYSLLQEFVVQNDESRLERKTIVYEDTVSKNMHIEDFYLHRGEEGIYIVFSGRSSQPSSISYSGSTSNRSYITLNHAANIKPGASFLSTQFISMGSEVVARRNIESRMGIVLVPYPDGITPILVSGFPSSKSDSEIFEKITAGYAVLINNSIPYSEVINEDHFTDIQAMTRNNISLIGSLKTGVPLFDDYMTQETKLRAFMQFINNQNVSSKGFMPDSLRYNLDTLAILSNNKIPFIFSSSVDPLTNNKYTKGLRNPQIAYLSSTATDMVLLPVSYPMSSSLTLGNDQNQVFSSWKSIVEGAAANDEMVLFLIRSSEIGDQSYQENFFRLFSYAKDEGMTFTTPDRVADHFKKLQSISYSGEIEGDTAKVKVINSYNRTISNVTFRVSVPVLTTGNYRTDDGEIVRTKEEENQTILYVRTEIPANSTKNLIIEPDTYKKSLIVNIPQYPIEGLTEISIEDETGNSLAGVDVLVDTTYYQTDKNGILRIDLKRGYHTISVKLAGYNKFSTDITVKGRLFIIPSEISKWLS